MLAVIATLCIRTIAFHIINFAVVKINLDLIQLRSADGCGNHVIFFVDILNRAFQIVFVATVKYCFAEKLFPIFHTDVLYSLLLVFSRFSVMIASMLSMIKC